MRRLEPFGEANVARNTHLVPGSRHQHQHQSVNVGVGAIQAEVEVVTVASASPASVVYRPDAGGHLAQALGTSVGRSVFQVDGCGLLIPARGRLSSHCSRPRRAPFPSLTVSWPTTSFHPMPALPLSDLLLPRTGADSDDRQVGCLRYIINPEVVLRRLFLAVHRVRRHNPTKRRSKSFRSLQTWNARPTTP